MRAWKQKQGAQREFRTRGSQQRDSETQLYAKPQKGPDGRNLQPARCNKAGGRRWRRAGCRNLTALTPPHITPALPQLSLNALRCRLHVPLLTTLCPFNPPPLRTHTPSFPHSSNSGNPYCHPWVSSPFFLCDMLLQFHFHSPMDAHAFAHRHGQVVKHLRAVAPPVGIAILPLALIIEPIHLKV